ncbi:MAG: hypothetical protein ACRDI2_01590 [Chloroflexota bacterium]
MDETPSALSLHFDCAIPYMGTDLDPRPLPRVPLYFTSAERRGIPASVRPLLDTGADYTLFDGNIALQLGWSEEDIAARADDAHAVHGLETGASPLIGYLHRLTCLISMGQRFATLQLSAFLTSPNTLSTPVLGRRDFFRQVDFALVDAERQVYLRFRDRTALRDSW